DQEIKKEVQKRYGQHAVRAQAKQASCCGPETRRSDCGCGPGVSFTQSIGYSSSETGALPDSTVNAAAGCGNPHALAGLKEGESLLDLGSGGGIDGFIASRKVGSTGRAVGVDMTDEMLDLARKGAQEMGLKNVEFRKGDIEDLPFGEAEFDVIISNCVINLAPDKDKVFREAYRVLKPGGRIAVSDIVTLGEMPEEMKKDMDSWASCVSGAIEANLYLDKLRDAGFTDVKIVSQRGSGHVFSAEVEGHKPQ
ncbi:arsenite methyltransferase, partial [Candidatus Bathyarchaeota archaeon]|nr:arsenite methyltransferase [Candidatus Bathyarchaeota archaeon]